MPPPSWFRRGSVGLLALLAVAVAWGVPTTSADFICTQSLRAKFHSLFIQQRPWVAAEDTAQLCELCSKVARYAIMYANDDQTRPNWAQTTRDNACTYAERHREKDCELLVDAVVDREAAYFASDKVRLAKDELGNTLTTALALSARASQFCVETMCCPVPLATNGTSTDAAAAAARPATPAAAGAMQPSAAPPGAAASANATTPTEARSIHFNRTADQVRDALERDRQALDEEKRVFDHHAAFLDAYRARLDKRDAELKLAQEEVDREKKLIAQGIVKKQMEKKLAEEEEKRSIVARKRAEEKKEEDAAEKRALENNDKIEAEAAKKIASASSADEGNRKAHEVRTRMKEETFKQQIKAFNERKEKREAEEKKEAEERAEVDKKREAAAGVKGGVAPTKEAPADAKGANANNGGGNQDLSAAKKFRVEEAGDDDDEEEDDSSSSSDGAN